MNAKRAMGDRLFSNGRFGRYSVASFSLILLATQAGLHGCVTPTEEERDQIMYELSEARVEYDKRGQACLDSGGYVVTDALTGSRRLTISEMKWAYCSR